MRRRHFLFLSALALSAPPFANAAPAADTTLAENAQPTKPAPATPPGEAAPHIALLLPLNSSAFRQPAEIVRQGFLAAAKAQPDAPPVRIYPTGGEAGDILATYAQAVSQGARVVVGPLTRNAVSALAASELVTVPTLALNTPDRENVAIPEHLYLLGLSVEEEARQVAELAARDGYRRPLVVVADSALAQRMQAAFAARWRDLGRKLAGVVRFPAKGELAGLRAAAQTPEADMIFLAATAQEARAVRPYLSAVLPTYATSQAFDGHVQDPRNVDLAGVRFVDMPWLLQPDHPAVMVYPRPDTALSAELERLYALGVDALRLAGELYRSPAPSAAMTLDGVTGRLSLGGTHIFSREVLPAEFQNDAVVLIDSGTP